MNTAVKTRQLNLEREAQVSLIEAQCLEMKVGQEKDYKILDTKVHQRLRKRLCATILNDKNIDMTFETKLRDDKLNTLTVTRKA